MNDAQVIAVDSLFYPPTEHRFKKRAPNWVVSLLLRLAAWLDEEWADQSLSYGEMEDRLEVAEEAVHQAAEFYARRGVRDMRESHLAPAEAPVHFGGAFYTMARQALGKETVNV